MSLECIICHNENLADSRFCASCGEGLSGRDIAEETATPTGDSADLQLRALMEEATSLREQAQTAAQTDGGTPAILDCDVGACRRRPVSATRNRTPRRRRTQGRTRSANATSTRNRTPRRRRTQGRTRSANVTSTRNRTPRRRRTQGRTRSINATSTRNRIGSPGRRGRDDGAGRLRNVTAAR